MEYRRLGNTGLKVSVLSYGAWVSFSTQLGVDGAYKIMKRAFESGINFFDNAESCKKLLDEHARF
jgi:aryl-alcohol dehydrogenase-like predicted oxidoreductase